jgi:capsular polysaccharide biosynthesis protein
MAEIELSVLARQCLSERMESKERLQREVAALAGPAQHPRRVRGLALHHQGGPRQTQAPLPNHPTLKEH